MQMKISLFLLGAFVCTGVSITMHDNKDYGETKHFWLPFRTHSVEFIPKDTSDVTVLWKQGDPPISEDKKLVKVSFDLQLSRLTQKDSGRYIMRDKDQKHLASHVLEVQANTKNYQKKHGDSLTIFSYYVDTTSCNIYFFPESKRGSRESKIEVLREGGSLEGLSDFGCTGFEPFRPCGIKSKSLRLACNGRFEVRDENDNLALEVTLNMERKEQSYERKPGMGVRIGLSLEKDSCNIYFIPEINYEPGKTVTIIHKGVMQSVTDSCVGFEQSGPCEVRNEHLQSSCNGHFEVRDQNGNEALRVTLEMEEDPDEISVVSIGAGIFFFFIIPIGCCMKYCCCGDDSSSKEDESEPAAEPAAEPPAPSAPAAPSRELNNEPFGPPQNFLTQPSWSPYPPAPSYTVTDPLIHCPPPPVDMPPPYSEITAAAAPTDAPTVSVPSDSEPRFELTGLNISSPPTDSNVYTSDKLNFL